MRLLSFIISVVFMLGIMDHALAVQSRKNTKTTSHVQKKPIKKSSVRSKTASKKTTKAPHKKSVATKKSSKKLIITHNVSSNTTTKKLTHKKAPAKRSAYPRVVTNSGIIYGSTGLAQQINELIRANGSSADIGVYVKSMRYGDNLYSRNAHSPLTPASTLKVLTAEAALLFLKPEYRFTTQLLTDGKTVKDGILQGNLYIVLSGDPSLTYNDLVNLILSLRTQQIYGVSGNVYIDNTAYDQRFYGPDWDYDDKNYCYAAPISASIINHNCLPFRVSPSSVPGHAAKVETSAKYFYPSIKNSVTTTARRSRSCGIRLSSDLSSGLEIEGCLSKGRDPVGLSYVVTDIPEYNRALFKSVLSQVGIRVYGRVTFGSVPSNPSMLSYHSSKPLTDLVKEMLKKSDNIIAGALFKKIGQIYTRKPGSWENGSYAVSQILSKVAGVNTSGLRVLDGSGLSPSNLVTPSQLMQVLSFTYHHPTTSDPFWEALPISGIDGTLKHRLGNITRKVRAKTGTISGVASLAGYVTASDQEMLAFVIIVNGSKGMTWKYRDLEDKIVTALSKYKRM